MPLEISEIGVHIAVGGGNEGPGAGKAPAKGKAPAGGQAVILTQAQHEAIVNACVQQVMENLRQMQER